MEEKDPDAQRWREVGEQRQGQGAGQRKQRRREKQGEVQREMETHRSERSKDQRERVRLGQKNWGYRHSRGGGGGRNLGLRKECTVGGHSDTPSFPAVSKAARGPDLSQAIAVFQNLGLGRPRLGCSWGGLLAGASGS